MKQTCGTLADFNNSTVLHALDNLMKYADSKKSEHYFGTLADFSANGMSPTGKFLAMTGLTTR